jgi:hypothetical protein
MTIAKERKNLNSYLDSYRLVWTLFGPSQGSGPHWNFISNSGYIERWQGACCTTRAPPSWGKVCCRVIITACYKCKPHEALGARREARGVRREV